MTPNPLMISTTVRVRDVWLVCAVALLVLALATGWTAYRFEQRFQERIRQNYTQTLDLATQALEHWSDSRLDEVRAWALDTEILQATAELRQTPVNALPASDWHARLQQRLTPVLRLQRYQNYWLVDHDSTILSSNVPTRIGQAAKMHAQTHAQLLSSGASVSPWLGFRDLPNYLHNQNVQLITALIPTDQPRPLQPMLVFQLSDQLHLSQLMRQFSPGLGGEVYAVTPEGFFASQPHALHNDDRYYTRSLQHNNLPLVPGQSFSVGNNLQNGAITHYRSYHGQPVIGSWRWLPRQHLFLFVEIAEPELISEQRMMHNHLLAGALLVAALMLLLTLLNDRLYRRLKQTQERLRRAQTAGALGIWEWQSQTHFLQWSPECAEILGYPAGHLPSVDPFFDQVDETERQTLQTMLDKFLQQAQNAPPEKIFQLPPYPMTITRRDGELRMVCLSASAQRDGEGWRVIGTLQDITQLDQARTRLARTEGIVNAVEQAIVVLDQEGRIREANHAFSRLTGYTEEQLQGQRLLALTNYPDTLDLSLLLDGAHSWNREVEFRHANGQRLQLWVSINRLQNAASDSHELVATLVDIGSLKASERQLQFLSEHDPLTGLANRQQLQSWLQDCPSGQTFALLVLRIDGFDEVSEQLGAPAGDLLLRRLAQRLQKQLPNHRRIARASHDSFALLFSDQTPQHFVSQTETLLQSLNGHYRLHNHNLSISLSAGLSWSSTDNPATQLLSQAEVALYRSSRHGRGGWQSFQDQPRELSGMAQELRDALENHQLSLYYQPEWEPAHPERLHIEALLRWPGAPRGRITPPQIIDCADKAGLLEQLTDWILQGVLTQLQQWLEQGYPVGRVGINLSGLELHNHMIQELQRRLQVDPQLAYHLSLEFDENVLADCLPSTQERLEQLRDLGVLITLDHFNGSELSLAQLHRLPVDQIKVSRLLVQSLTHEHPPSIKLLRSIAQLGSELGMGLIAKGVEHIEQQQILQQLGYLHYQGYYYSPVLAFVDMQHLLQQWAQGPQQLPATRNRSISLA